MFSLMLFLMAAPADPALDAYRRGLKLADERNHTAAIAEFDKAIAADAKLLVAWDRRGDAKLKLGQWKAAVADFDKSLELEPKLAPEHWRRGIALYYLKEYKKGVEQFQTHKTVNPQDVENAVWHYLCNVHVVGAEKARAELIDVTRDRRVPMAEIQKLYAGKLEPADVLKAANAVGPETEAGTEARFYADLYVGLWYESAKQAEKAKEHMLAAQKRTISHYMWDVANAHVENWKK
ncbi:MAG: tetratricopeptide repeat protein [Gemmataceae bacterium]